MKTNTSSIDDRRQFFMADFQYLPRTLPGAAFKIMRSILQYISSSAEMLLKYRGKLSMQQNSYSKITPKLCHMIPLVIHRAPPTLRQCCVTSQRARKRWSKTVSSAISRRAVYWQRTGNPRRACHCRPASVPGSHAPCDVTVVNAPLTTLYR